MRARRIVLLIGTTLLSINVWTGCPLLALWVGSQVQGESTQPKMAAVATVVAVLAVAVLAFEVWFFFFAGSPLPGG